MEESRFDAKIDPDKLENLPFKEYDGEIIVINSLKAFTEVIEELEQEEALGFDTETKPSFKRGENNSIAILQLSTKDKAYIFQLHLAKFPQRLFDLLANEEIIKVGVAVRDDILGLQRIQKFKPGAFIDLQDYVSYFGIEDNGLKKLVGNVLGFRISKRQRLSNWENEILDRGQLKYAAMDAWSSLMIYLKLTKK